MGRDGVFSLLTQAPLSEHGALSGHWQCNDDDRPPAARSAPPRHPRVRSSFADGAEEPSASPAPSDESKEEEEEEKKQNDADAWFAEQASGPPREDVFVHDAVTAGLLETVGEMLDGDVEGIELSAQQASVMRYLIVRNFEPMRHLVSSMQEASSPPSSEAVASFLSKLEPLVAHQLLVEESCRDAQLTELAALHSIFGTARELSIYQTHPITIKVIVALQSMDCSLELGFAMPAGYPDEEALKVCSFIPPPYQGLKIRRTEADVDLLAAAAAAATSDSSSSSASSSSATSSSSSAASSAVGDLVCIDDLLQAALVRKSVALVGEGGGAAVYSLIEECRDFMERHQEALVKEAREEAEVAAQASASVLQLDSIQLFGRGRIEKLEAQAIEEVQAGCDLPESIARAKLKESKWDAQLCLQKHREALAKEMAAAGSSTLPPRSSPSSSSASASSSPALAMLPPKRQDSTAERDRFEQIQHTFAPYRADPTATLSCSACCEDLQLREVAGQVCGHVMCVLCWRRMLSTHISQGSAFLRCVGFKCACFVEEGLILTMVDAADYKRYRRWLQDSFIQLRGWRWCTNAKCNKVASAGAASGDQFAVVSCTCSAQWCFSCGREGHWPISCDASRQYARSKLVRDMRKTVQSRIGAIKPEEDFVRVEVKRCPKCSTPWERNGGCNQWVQHKQGARHVKSRGLANVRKVLMFVCLRCMLFFSCSLRFFFSLAVSNVRHVVTTIALFA